MRPFNITIAAGVFATLAASAAWAQEVDWKKVDEAFGRSGAVAGHDRSDETFRGTSMIPQSGYRFSEKTILQP